MRLCYTIVFVYSKDPNEEDTNEWVINEGLQLRRTNATCRTSIKKIRTLHRQQVGSNYTFTTAFHWDKVVFEPGELVGVDFTLERLPQPNNNSVYPSTVGPEVVFESLHHNVPYVNVLTHFMKVLEFNAMFLPKSLSENDGPDSETNLFLSGGI